MNECDESTDLSGSGGVGTLFYEFRTNDDLVFSGQFSAAVGDQFTRAYLRLDQVNFYNFSSALTFVEALNSPTAWSFGEQFVSLNTTFLFFSSPGNPPSTPGVDSVDAHTDSI